MKFKKIEVLEEKDLIKDVDFLNEHCIGWLKIWPDLASYVVNVIRWVDSDKFTCHFQYEEYYVISKKERKKRKKELYSLVDIKKIVKYELIDNRIYSDDDPYGEENWVDNDDVFESKMKKLNEGIWDIFKKDDDDDEEVPTTGRQKPPLVYRLEFEKIYPFSEFIRFDLLGKRKLDALREALDDQFIVIFHGRDKQTRGRFASMKPLKIADEQYYVVNLITKFGEVEVTIQPYDRFRVKIPKKSSVDPYNEEDWNIFSSDVVPQKKEIIRYIGGGEHEDPEEQEERPVRVQSPPTVTRKSEPEVKRGYEIPGEEAW